MTPDAHPRHHVPLAVFPIALVLAGAAALGLALGGIDRLAHAVTESGASYLPFQVVPAAGVLLAIVLVRATALARSRWTGGALALAAAIACAPWIVAQLAALGVAGAGPGAMPRALFESAALRMIGGTASACLFGAAAVVLAGLAHPPGATPRERWLAWVVGVVALLGVGIAVAGQLATGAGVGAIAIFAVAGGAATFALTRAAAASRVPLALGSGEAERRLDAPRATFAAGAALFAGAALGAAADATAALRFHQLAALASEQASPSADALAGAAELVAGARTSAALGLAVLALAALVVLVVAVLRARERASEADLAAATKARASERPPPIEGRLASERPPAPAQTPPRAGARELVGLGLAAVVIVIAPVLGGMVRGRLTAAVDEARRAPWAGVSGFEPLQLDRGEPYTWLDAVVTRERIVRRGGSGRAESIALSGADPATLAATLAPRSGSADRATLGVALDARLAGPQLRAVLQAVAHGGRPHVSLVGAPPASRYDARVADALPLAAWFLPGPRALPLSCCMGPLDHARRAPDAPRYRLVPADDLTIEGLLATLDAIADADGEAVLAAAPRADDPRQPAQVFAALRAPPPPVPPGTELLGHGGGGGEGSAGDWRAALARRQLEPRIEPAPPEVRGTLGVAVVERVQQRYRGALRHCHEQGIFDLTRHGGEPPDAPQTVRLATVIGTGGAVWAVAVDHRATTAPAATAACFALAWERPRYPETADGVVHVAQTFTLVPAPVAEVPGVSLPGDE